MDMRTRLLTSALLLTLCCAALPAQEQNYVPTPVTISKEKVKLGDKTYYSHVVLERQTLYSIAKAYGVAVEDIYAANPELELEKNGLKKNSIIRIPIADEKAVALSAPNDAADGVTHTVKWYEDLQGIAEKYGVSPESIMEANGLRDGKLKSRMKLIIPSSSKSESVAITEPQVEPEEEAETNIVEGDGSLPAKTDDELATEAKKELDFALILPFKAAGGFASTNYMDFYCGALLAAREAGQNGIEVELSVYDDGSSLPALGTERLEAFDVVIGPVGKANMEALLQRAPEGCTLVSPLDPKTGSLSENWPMLCQANSDSNEQYADLVKWIADERKPGDKVLVIYEKSKTALRNRMDTLLRDRGIAFTELSYNILEGRNIGDALKAKMSTGACNRVLIASESEAFVNDVVRNLNVAVHEQYDIALYGPSKFKSFETIDIDNLHNVRLHLSLSYYIDYDREDVKSFIMKYRALYGTEPSAFAFQGYDLMQYFTEACSRYGGKWRDRMDGKKVELLQSDICFERLPGRSGLTNTALRRVIYGPDCSVEILK